jgi:hypothetical protein
LDGDAGTHLGQVLGLLVDAHVDAALGQRVGRGETTDAAADNSQSKPIHAHGLLRTLGSFTSPSCAERTAQRPRRAARASGRCSAEFDALTFTATMSRKLTRAET